MNVVWFSYRSLKFIVVISLQWKKSSGCVDNGAQDHVSDNPPGFCKLVPLYLGGLRLQRPRSMPVCIAFCFRSTLVIWCCSGSLGNTYPQSQNINLNLPPEYYREFHYCDGASDMPWRTSAVISVTCIWVWWIGRQYVLLHRSRRT
jgi:hypothetical protein